MNFLDIVNQVRSEAGVAGGDLTTLQTGLNAESTRFVNWAKSEWRRLQAESDQWRFLRVDGEFQTTAGQSVYTAQQAQATDDATDTGTAILADWVPSSFRVSTVGASYRDESILVWYQAWEDFRDVYRYGSARTTQGRPVSVTQDPQRRLHLGHVPDAAYVITYEFVRTPQELVLDDDEPIMPARFHEVVVYRALRAYGIFTSAPEVIGRADEVLNTLNVALVNDQLPAVLHGPPLA